MCSKSLACLICFASAVAAMPARISENSREDDSAAVGYLSKFGYLSGLSLRTANGSPASLLSAASPEVSSALREFQDFAGIAVTGKLDQATKEAMALPRCGVKDKNMIQLRFRRYVKHGSRWHKNRVTYKINSYPRRSGLSRRDVDDVMEQAFNVWSAPKSSLTFSRSGGRHADIIIDFFSGDHGRNDEPFDGPGGVLAHAFFPQFGGDVHFDDSEPWSVRRPSSHRQRREAKQLLQTAAHEIGHSLGLQHSKDRNALMAPFYREWMDDVSLRSDDLAGIRAIYGKSKTESKPTTTTTTRRPPPSFVPVVTSRPGNRRPVVVNRPTSGGGGFGSGQKTICENPRIDAAVQTADGSFYVFRGALYWKLRTKQAGVEPGYPRSVSDWAGIPGKIDAAFYDPATGHSYIFRQGRVAKFRNMDLVAGYPRPIRDEFGSAAPASDVDAALVWGKNDQLYFFKGTQYWKYNFAKRQIEHSYPRSVARNWVGVPSHLGAALRWTNGKSYFFSRTGEYYRFDDDALTVDQKSSVPFPRTVGRWWFGCHRSALAEEEEEEGTAKEEEKTRTPRGRWEWSG